MTTLSHVVRFRMTPEEVATLERLALMHDRKLGTEIRRAVRRYIAGELGDGARPRARAAEPARDRLTVKLPREERRHVQPPTAEHVEAAVRLLPSRYRLPMVVLDATGMRVGELEALAWGDIDEPRARWRIDDE